MSLWDKRFQTNGGHEVHPSALRGSGHPAQMKHVKHSKRDLDDNNYIRAMSNTLVTSQVIFFFKIETSGCYC